MAAPYFKNFVHDSMLKIEDELHIENEVTTEEENEHVQTERRKSLLDEVKKVQKDLVGLKAEVVELRTQPWR